jgi:hypothetical protein
MKKKREVNYCYLWGFGFFLPACLITLFYYYFFFSDIYKVSSDKLKERKKKYEFKKEFTMKASFFFSFVAEKREMAMERERERLVEFRRLKKNPRRTMAPAMLALFLLF